MQAFESHRVGVRLSQLVVGPLARPCAPTSFLSRIDNRAASGSTQLPRQLCSGLLLKLGSLRRARLKPIPRGPESALRDAARSGSTLGASLGPLRWPLRGTSWAPLGANLRPKVQAKRAPGLPRSNGPGHPETAQQLFRTKTCREWPKAPPAAVDKPPAGATTRRCRRRRSPRQWPREPPPEASIHRLVSFCLA